mmetsp:Transcript_27048/g.35108  ORF Transcript_27048/g.35108 Transcript_27048/m.35108 type:complete len:156 (+) Transcript_27048:1191-1658(+)
MENERYNYIILDSVGSTWDAINYKATWTIPFHYYTEYETNDDIYIALENCIFTAETGNPTVRTCTVYMENVLPINQTTTDIRTMLGIIPCDTSSNTPTAPVLYFSSPSNVDCNNMKLKVNRFEKITLHVDSEGDELNFGTDIYRFILKVSYKKKN